MESRHEDPCGCVATGMDGGTIDIKLCAAHYVAVWSTISGTIETGPEPGHGPGSASSAPAEDGDAGPLYGPHKPHGHEGDTSGAT
jgi:hypothetical protein